jgi:hypothetical protein
MLESNLILHIHYGCNWNNLLLYCVTHNFIFFIALQLSKIEGNYFYSQQIENALASYQVNKQCIYNLLLVCLYFL